MIKKGTSMVIVLVLIFILAGCASTKVINEVVTEEDYIAGYEIENQIDILQKYSEEDSVILLYEKDEQYVIDYCYKYNVEDEISISKYSWETQKENSIESRGFGTEENDYIIVIFNDDEIFNKTKNIKISLEDISFEYEINNSTKANIIMMPERPKKLTTPEIVLYDIDGEIIEH